MAKGYFFSFKKRRGDHTILWALLVLIVITAIIAGVLMSSDAHAQKQMAGYVARAARAMEDDANSVSASITLGDSLKSKSYILLRLSDYNNKLESKTDWISSDAEYTGDAYRHNRILLTKSANKKIYPASMAKIITVLVIIENIKNYDEKITLTDKDFNHYFIDGASIAGFQSGDKLTVQDMLYSVMITSGSECTTALARHVAGSEEAFVGLMNDKAAEIGMEKTHFTNPIGLHSKDNYSTVSDIALALNYAILNKEFYPLFTTQEYKTAHTKSQPKGLELKSTLFQKEGLTLEFTDGAILGGKTGYTSDAGQCLASLFIKDGETFILVTAAAMPDNFRTEALHVDDLLKVYDQVKVVKEES
jgi:D-alanyl-D-alanine carboxypeptidase (penicillin-binding protein 5/6)